MVIFVCDVMLVDFGVSLVYLLVLFLLNMVVESVFLLSRLFVGVFGV